MTGLTLKWPQPPAQCPLRGTEIHVWAVTLAVPSERIALCHGMLAPDERARAARFHFERDRNRFIVARGVLRMMLASYTDLEAGALEFKYGPKGKPSLVEGSGGRGTFF